MPAQQGWDPRDRTCQGKVERPFRTVKEAHETLYHFHKPDTEARRTPGYAAICCATTSSSTGRNPMHATDWLANLPAEGLREMCTWEQFVAWPASRNGARSVSTHG